MTKGKHTFSLFIQTLTTPFAPVCSFPLKSVVEASRSCTELVFGGGRLKKDET